MLPKRNLNAWFMGVASVVVFLVVIILNFNKGAGGKFKVVFCDVGQGDAIYFKTPSGMEILVDGGPDERVLECLSHHMPFWDRTLDLVVISHPQADHISGLIPLLKRFRVDNILIGSQTNNKSPEFKELVRLILDEKITVKNPFLGQKIDFGDGVKAQVLWPEKKWLADRLSDQNGKVLGVSNINLLNKKTELGVFSFTGDLNLTSIIMIFQYGSFDILLTGDADSSIQPLILQKKLFTPVEILKVPHHGSKKALTDKFLKTVKPKLAVISVGKNSFGHPAKDLIRRLTDMKISLLRTDKDGEIAILTDGKNWEVK